MKDHLGRLSLLVMLVYVLVESALGFNKIAWGTGLWWGEYSLKWGFLFFLFTVSCLFILLFAGLILWQRERVRPLFEKMILFRERLKNVRWLFGLFVLVAPVWFFRYTLWGVVFSDIYFRLLIWTFVVVGFAFFIKKGNTLFDWSELLIAVLLTSGEFVIVASFMGVTDYPFSLGWSEGNRLWDYSIIFGSELYNYPLEKNIVPFLDIGRQIVGGIPFLLPTVTIGMERFWVSLLGLLPYVLLGLAVFYFEKKTPIVWALLALWTMMFLKQGPIHPPLVLLAVVVAFIWRRPFWLAIPLISVVGFLAVQSRFTWMFAPGMWIGMLELASAALQQNGKLPPNAWLRAISFGIAGIFGGYFGPKLLGILSGDANASVAISASGVVSSVSEQPLLWYRLLPNATYGSGILVGLLIATLPLLTVLFYLLITKKWVLNVWQGLALLVPLLAFLSVGVIVSTKIGGGGDLHNMDMFFIGLLFAAVLAWQNGGKKWFDKIDLQPLGIKFAFILLFAIPGFQSLGQIRSFDFAEDVSKLATLTDEPTETSFDMYPSQETTDSALNIIREEIDLALSKGGEVLFMDQRQLLTFGYITKIPLVPEYEKKLLMNQALSSDANYFQGFYDDLEKHRFQLIISEPLRTPVKDDSFQFGEENNAWVTWVSTPVLCYYEPKITLKEVGVQLLVPSEQVTDCSASLP